MLGGLKEARGRKLGQLPIIFFYSAALTLGTGLLTGESLRAACLNPPDSVADPVLRALYHLDPVVSQTESFCQNQANLPFRLSEFGVLECPANGWIARPAQPLKTGESQAGLSLSEQMTRQMAQNNPTDRLWTWQRQCLSTRAPAKPKGAMKSLAEFWWPSDEQKKLPTENPSLDPNSAIALLVKREKVRQAMNRQIELLVTTDPDYPGLDKNQCRDSSGKFNPSDIRCMDYDARWTHVAKFWKDYLNDPQNKGIKDIDQSPLLRSSSDPSKNERGLLARMIDGTFDRTRDKNRAIQERTRTEILTKTQGREPPIDLRKQQFFWLMSMRSMEQTLTKMGKWTQGKICKAGPRKGMKVEEIRQEILMATRSETYGRFPELRSKAGGWKNTVEDLTEAYGNQMPLGRIASEAYQAPLKSGDPRICDLEEIPWDVSNRVIQEQSEVSPQFDALLSQTERTYYAAKDDLLQKQFDELREVEKDPSQALPRFADGILSSLDLDKSAVFAGEVGLRSCQMKRNTQAKDEQKDLGLFVLTSATLLTGVGALAAGFTGAAAETMGSLMFAADALNVGMTGIQIAEAERAKSNAYRAFFNREASVVQTDATLKSAQSSEYLGALNLAALAPGRIIMPRIAKQLIKAEKLGESGAALVSQAQRKLQWAARADDAFEAFYGYENYQAFKEGQVQDAMLGTSMQLGGQGLRMKHSERAMKQVRRAGGWFSRLARVH